MDSILIVVVLPGAVRPKQPKDFLPPDGERHIVDSGDPVELFTQVLCFEEIVCLIHGDRISGR